jgi:hypothetical protein
MLSGLQHIQNLAKHYSKETPFPMITCEERMWPNNNHHYSQYTFPANCSMHVRNESHTSSYVGPFCAFGAHIVRYVRRGVTGDLCATTGQRDINRPVSAKENMHVSRRSALDTLCCVNCKNFHIRTYTFSIISVTPSNVDLLISHYS